MTILCVFTDEFPYGKNEPYLETEIAYYPSSCFDRVVIFANDIKKKNITNKRNVPGKIEVLPIIQPVKWKYLLKVPRVVLDREFWKELWLLIRLKKVYPVTLRHLLIYMCKAYYFAEKMNREMNFNKNDKIIFYSYRFFYSSYAAILLEKMAGIKCSKICRAHGFDLYYERQDKDYAPLRNAVYQKYDYVFPCSKMGEAYLREKAGQWKEKIIVSYLGTAEYGIRSYEASGNSFRMLSCSNMVPVKRIDLLIQALMKIQSVKIEWTHFGDGDEWDRINTLCKQLPSHVEAKLMGSIKHEELMRILTQNSFDVFINVSASEGLPVSIMEAMSVGIPCIATDVGGTKEIVNQDNGILLSTDPSAEEIADALTRFAEMPLDEYQNYRKKARSSWEMNFRADKNYREFLEFIHSNLQ